MLSNDANDLYLRALNKVNMGKFNAREVLTLLEKADLGGAIDATYALGSWYFHGENVEQNIDKALELWLSASERGSSDASFELAVYYETNEGAKNLPQAFYFYTKSALQGDIQSFYEVGRLYFYGIGCDKSQEIAQLWLDKAKTLGVKE